MRRPGSEVYVTTSIQPGPAETEGPVPPSIPPMEGLSLELPEILFAVRRRWWLVVALVLVCGGVFFVAASRQLKVYVATAKIVLEPQLPKVLDEDLDMNSGVAQAEAVFYNTQYEIMRSRAVVRGAIAQLKLAEDPAFLEVYGLTGVPADARVKAIEDVLAARVEVVPEHQSRIVTVQVEDFDADRAARIANTLTQVYIDQSLESRLSENHSASKWLDERVGEFGKRLDESEKTLHEYKRSNMLVSVSLEDRKNMTTQRLTALNEKLNEIRAKLIELESERDTLKTVIKEGVPSGPEALSVPRIARSSVIEALMASQVELEKEHAKLSSRYGEKHPNMAAVQLQLDRIAGRLREEIARNTASLDNEITELKTAEVRLNGEISEEVKKAMDLNTLAVEYNRLNRDVGTNERTYGALLKRQTEADLSGLLKSNFVRWLETAEPVHRPVRPSVPLSTTLGALLGLALALGAIVLGVLIDNTVHTQEDVEDRLHLPFLGVLPSIEEGERAKAKVGDMVQGPVPTTRDLYIVKNPKSTVAECARSLRTNLLFLGARRPLRRLLVTSAGPSEGKSTTVIALGSTMALAGNRVLLVDTDFRRPRLHRTFGMNNDQGLTSVLLGEAKLEQVIRATDVRNLDILTCGAIPPNPSELLHTEAFLKLLDEMSARYDRVILDSPPVNVVTDATILSQITDGTILVIKASKTTKDSARRAARQLVDINANLLGVVLNDLDLSDEGYYRQQKYYYYYKGYEYSDGEKEAKA